MESSSISAAAEIFAYLHSQLSSRRLRDASSSGKVKRVYFLRCHTAVVNRHTFLQSATPSTPSGLGNNRRRKQKYYYRHQVTTPLAVQQPLDDADRSILQVLTDHQHRRMVSANFPP